ncbi:MAG: type I-C CRISPR-associated endonuclease Cas1c [Planctomycetes bacterium]|nr:type I-C CRISPR-associated endonuclease Cas1c [Planctomycetota bacterium]
MHRHANTLYITTQGAYLRRDHATLQVKIENKVRLTVPLHHLEGVVCFGRVTVSHGVYEAVKEQGLAVSFLTQHGRFLARVAPPTQGNVLLRRTQYRMADDTAACLSLARPMIAAKIQNARNVLLRAARDAGDEARVTPLRAAARQMGALLIQLVEAIDLNAARGVEGSAARVYFDGLTSAIRSDEACFALNGRSRRPPRDPVNAMLSFAYALLRHDCQSALESVGLDPAVGYLHVDRPGRPSLALDIMEEFRALVADRLVLALINRRQVRGKNFSEDLGGTVSMDDAAGRAMLVAWQERKREEVKHPLLEETVPIGLLPHIQARLLARTLRGDLAEYPALVMK